MEARGPWEALVRVQIPAPRQIKKLKIMAEFITQEGLEKLKKELNYLKKIKRKEIAQKLKQAASFGDLRENFAYHQAKEEQAFVEGRIIELEKIIAQAKIIEKKKTDVVEIGSKVILSDNKRTIEIEIVGSKEANPLDGKISFSSPLGEALLGKREGQKVIVKTPKGEIEYRIIKIS